MQGLNEKINVAAYLMEQVEFPEGISFTHASANKIQDN